MNEKGLDLGMVKSSLIGGVFEHRPRAFGDSAEQGSKQARMKTPIKRIVTIQFPR